METQRTRTAKTTLNNENTIPILDLKTYCRAIIIKTAWPSHTHQPIEWNWELGYKLTPLLSPAVFVLGFCLFVCFDKEAKMTLDYTGQTACLHVEEWNLVFSSHFVQNNYIWFRDLSVRPDGLNLTEQKVGYASDYRHRGELSEQDPRSADFKTNDGQETSQN